MIKTERGFNSEGSCWYLSAEGVGLGGGGGGVRLIYGASCFWQQPAKSRHSGSLGYQSTEEFGVHFKWAHVILSNKHIFI